MEGDLNRIMGGDKPVKFQSTPSVWRVTEMQRAYEGDMAISIHTLRMEGDKEDSTVVMSALNFNPHPPYGG